ncbi:hypothetical protein H4R18_002318 [Coemansia javaensis]|uniref:Uncharacterized protein n=1 Tax=Coemansia javaensis TaxID=2761396 RepID=A0A9W8LIY3_9FUNG|nr:hypothetical protein H4R18_002318 [Coemansia javaensis]
MDGSPRRGLLLRVRRSDGTTTEHWAAGPEMTVGELKQSLARSMHLPRERIRLVLGGAILADEHTLAHYGIDGSSVIGLVQLAGAAAPGPRNVTGIVSAGQPPPVPLHARNGLAQQPFPVSHQLVRMLMMANPRMREAMENNSELREMMSDPEIMRQGIDAAQNPQLMQELQRNNDRVLYNLEASPGGFEQIRRMYNTIQEPLAMASFFGDRSSLDELNRRRARDMGVTNPDTSKVNTTPLPNPWARRQPRPSMPVGFDVRNSSNSNSNSNNSTPAAQHWQNTNRLARLDISNGQPAAAAAPRRGHHPPAPAPAPAADLSALFGQWRPPAPAPPASAPAPPAPAPAPPAARAPGALSDSDMTRGLEQYRDTLEELEEMGFLDKEKNLRALMETDGDLDRALNIIAGEDDG